MVTAIIYHCNAAPVYRPCMINRIAIGKWSYLISFALAPPSCEERQTSKTIQNKNVCQTSDLSLFSLVL